MLTDSINRMLKVLCFPFNNMDFYSNDLLQAYLQCFQNDGAKNSKKLLASKAKLHESVVEHLQTNASVHTRDEVYLLIDKCYLHDLHTSANESVEKIYLNVMSKLARAFLSQRDGKIVYKYWNNENDLEFLGGFGGHNKLLFFHALSRHIPMDQLIVRYLLDNDPTSDKSFAVLGLHNNFSQIYVGDQLLEQVLSKGVAENHLHAGASSSFYTFWMQLTIPTILEKSGRLEQVVKYDKQIRKHLVYILSAGVLRAVMALFIANKTKFEFYQFIENTLKSNASITKDAELLLSLICELSNGGNIEKWGALHEIGSQNKTASIPEICGLFNRIWNTVITIIKTHHGSFPQKSEDVLKSIFVESPNLKTHYESIFLFECMKILDLSDLDRSQNFAKLFFQYLRIRSYTFSLYVQETHIKGLDHFQRFYSRNSGTPGNRNDRDFWGTAFREQLQIGNMQKIEFRIAPSASTAKFELRVRDFLLAYRQVLREDYCEKNGDKYIPIRKLPRIGLVVHLLKREDLSVPNKCWNMACHFYSDNEGEEYQRLVTYGEQQKKYEKEIDAILTLRNKHPLLSKYIVGLDAASLENATPVQVLAPVFLHSRGSVKERLHIQRNNKPLPVQSLRFTFHAGEDFRHLISGLRRMDEIITYAKFHAGDRIGHGIALGVNPQSWGAENPIVIVPQIEMLENYLWIWLIFSTNSHESINDLSYIDHKIYKIAQSIYTHTEGLTTQVLIDAYQRSFQIPKYNSLYDIQANNSSELKDNNPNRLFCKEVGGHNAIMWNAEKLLSTKSCRHYVINMNKPVAYEVTPEDINICVHAQKLLKEKLSREGIFIEINPTSNIVIGESQTLFDHHIYVVNQFFNDKNNVLACINTDDPSVFNTNITNELAYIYYGLLEKGIGRESALAWIDKIRQNGLKASFIHENISDEQLMSELNELLTEMGWDS